MPKLHSTIICLTLVSLMTATASAQDAKPDPAPGGVQLLPGYKHQTLQGIDSRPGKIFKEGGLEIMYDIGRIPKAGGFRLGGDYSDWAKRVPAKDQRWYREQTINGHPVYLVYTKKQRLTVSFPKGGINFSCEAKTEQDLVDALLMTLSYVGSKEKK